MKKTTDSRDPLDRKIDELLGETSVRPSSDFVSRTLQAAEAIEQEKPVMKSDFKIIPFALPIAAVLVMALLLSSQLKIENTGPLEKSPQIATNLSADSTATSSQVSESAELQEILLLQEGLSGLAAIESASLDESDWLQTLDALYFDIES